MTGSFEMKLHYPYPVRPAPGGGVPEKTTKTVIRQPAGLPMDPGIEVNQPQTLEDPDKKQQNLDAGGKTPFPKNADTNQDQQPFQGGDEVAVMLGIPVGERTEVTVMTQGKEVAV